ncbi:unnamed protein product [Zymoseptoria tritici ST99CH_3D1]|nr:unnamed protein product [Zymoseptoria tritici ST99CH_3D1]
MPPTDDPLDSDSDAGITVEKRRFGRSALSAISTALPYRRSNANLSNLFASTSSLPTLANPGSPGGSRGGTPTTAPLNGAFSPPRISAVRSPSPSLTGPSTTSDTRDLILRAFSPHVSVLASPDTEELIRHKGISGGLLELLRPFGEHISGKVTIRDSSGVSKSWEDYSVRFVAVKDGLESPRSADRSSADSATLQQGSEKTPSLLEFKPARLRTGGDVPQVEQLVERHLTFSEEQSAPAGTDYLTANDEAALTDPRATSPFYSLYLRRIFSGIPMVPSESISHPVASVIAISSRSPAPIEELRSLYDSSNTGEHRLPQWVHNEFLRYYVLIHDEDYDDITKSMSLYDQMKRHFGLHCHLLRLRSTQCVPSDDDSSRLPPCEWNAAAEELAEISRRETTDDEDDPTPYIFESDATAVRAFVREMVTQSIIPSMERASATWNDQVASRRRGISGRFMSLSKRFTTFGGRAASGPSLGGAGSNFDAQQGFYRPDSAEAIMRKLADYCMMLRDFRLAHGVYEILCQDFKNDKAWRHYAGANEMAAVSLLLSTPANSKIRIEGIDQYLETAYYSYITRVTMPYHALRTLLLGVELLKMRDGNALDDAARWCAKVLEDRLVGPVGYSLIMERIANCYSAKTTGLVTTGDGRRRKSAFWWMLAAESWMKGEKTRQAEKCLGEALRLYESQDKSREDDAKVEGVLRFDAMDSFLLALRESIERNRGGVHHIDGEDLLSGDPGIEAQDVESEQLGQVQDFSSAARAHRRSISGSASSASAMGFDPLGAMSSAHEGQTTLSPVRERERRDDGFE